MAERTNLGERISSLEATVDGMNKYAHERWHDLNNTLQPLSLLPERMIRDIAKLQGGVDGQINAVSKDIARTVTTAVERALLPVIADVAELKCEVENLKIKSTQMSGAKMLGVFILQTIIAAATAVAGMITLGRHP